MQPVRTVLVDDHAIVREGLLFLLDRDPDIHVVGTAGTGEEALPLIRQIEPDVVVTDYRLPGMSGTELCAQVVSSYPRMAVILLTMFLDDFVVRAALEAGARAYVCKEVDAEGLIRAIRAVARGDMVFDPRFSARIMRWARGTSSPELPLTSREAAVLRLAGNGLTNRSIGERLGLSEHTVHTYLSRIFSKLDCRSRTEAVTVATRHGML